MQALVLHPTGAGTLLAAAALAAGAPLFSDGLRALRLRRGLRALRPAPLGELADGLTHASGCVTLESPLFAPLSGRPCAGWRLAVSNALQPVPRVIEEWRDFRLVDGTASARVEGTAAAWDLMVTAWRDVAPGEPLSENVRALLERLPDGRWLRESGQPLRLVEHALCAGATAHVIGHARLGEARVAFAGVAATTTVRELRTGTDGATVTIEDDAPPAPSPAAAFATALAPEWTLGADEALGFLRVCDAPPRPERLRVSALRVGGLALGPALGLAGMIYLTQLADWLRVHGGF
jgi:hypothetical protein